jgi:hypothetical protein
MQLWAYNQIDSGIAPADKEAYTDSFWIPAYLNNWIEAQGNKFYSWLTEHTAGDILKAAKSLERHGVWGFRGGIYGDYGGGAPQDLQAFEEEFSKSHFKGTKTVQSDPWSSSLRILLRSRTPW